MNAHLGRRAHTHTPGGRPRFFLTGPSSHADPEAISAEGGGGISVGAGGIAGCGAGAGAGGCVGG